MYQLTDSELHEVTGGVAIDPPYTIDPPFAIDPP